MTGLLSTKALADSPSGADETAIKFNTMRADGYKAMYNLEYAEAQRIFELMSKEFPAHPGCWHFLATNLWLKTLNDSRRLQTSLYNSDSFYAEEEDKVDPSVLQQFREWSRTAKYLAEARLKQNPKDIEALYFLGASEGLRAAFAAAVERRFIGALRESSRGVDHHRDALKLDPNYHDAELSIGVYDYVVGSLPGPVKVLAAIGGVHGSTARGIETLARVAAQGEWTRDDAKVLLIAFLKREKRYDKAYELAQELEEKYPVNYLFKLEAADAKVLQAAADRKTDKKSASDLERQAFAIFDSLIADSSNSKVARALDQIHFSYGQALFAAGRFKDAVVQFTLATRAVGAAESLITLAQLKAGQSLDLASLRADALTRYKIVSNRPNVYDSLKEAQRGLKAPYKLP